MRWRTAESLAAPGGRPRRAARWIVLVVGLAGLLAGCGSAAPLVTNTQQAGMSECTPAPNVGARIGLDDWKSAVGISVGMYYNQSPRSLTVRSVSLVGAHNMVLHGAMVYEMPRYRNPLPSMFQWEYGSKGPGVNSELVQQVPGAVIPPGIGPVANFVKQHPDVYEIGVDVSLSCSRLLLTQLTSQAQRNSAPQGQPLISPLGENLGSLEYQPRSGGFSTIVAHH